MDKIASLVDLVAIMIIFILVLRIQLSLSRLKSILTRYTVILIKIESDKGALSDPL